MAVMTLWHDLHSAWQLSALSRSPPSRSAVRWCTSDELTARHARCQHLSHMGLASRYHLRKLCHRASYPRCAAVPRRSSYCLSYRVACGCGLCVGALVGMAHCLAYPFDIRFNCLQPFAHQLKMPDTIFVIAAIALQLRYILVHIRIAITNGIHRCSNGQHPAD
jgi:hypothetical protein